MGTARARRSSSASLEGTRHSMLPGKIHDPRGAPRAYRRPTLGPGLLRYGFIAQALQGARFPPLRIMLNPLVLVRIMSCLDVADFARRPTYGMPSGRGR